MSWGGPLRFQAGTLLVGKYLDGSYSLGYPMEGCRVVWLWMIGGIDISCGVSPLPGHSCLEGPPFFLCLTYWSLAGPFRDYLCWSERVRARI